MFCYPVLTFDTFIYQRILVDKMGQKTLTSNGKIEVIVDNRELRGKIGRELFKLDIEVVPKQLEIADFLISNEVAIERKSVSDFVNSIIDKRLFKQARDLKENFRKPIFLVEGEKDIYSVRNVHPNAIRGALSSLAINFSIPILWTESEKDTAKLLKTMARREQEEKEKAISIRGERKPLRGKRLQKYIVESFPNIGPKLAENLLERFKTIKNIVNADLKELKEVEKIGDKTASRLKGILEKEYET